MCGVQGGCVSRGDVRSCGAGNAIIGDSAG